MSYQVNFDGDSISLRLTLETVTFMVDGTPSTLQKLPMRLPFTRKPCTLADLSGGELSSVYIYRRVDMHELVFDSFSRNLARDADWLKDACPALPLGNARACIMVVAQGRPLLFVDTQGASYARYVARLG